MRSNALEGLKPSADKVMLGSKLLVTMIPDTEPIVGEAKRILTQEERQSFWRLFRTRYVNLSTAKVRKAHADEISFYWAMIPFDIDEPFFVVETATERFVADFQDKDGKITLFWIDLVGDLRTLKTK